MSLYIKGQEVEAMFMYDGDLIDSNDASVSYTHLTLPTTERV